VRGELHAEEVAELAVSDRELPSLSLSGEVRLRPERREAFLQELRTSSEELLSRHGGGDGQAFRIALACYPKGDLQ
jgi:hypothetical protein